ncbi:MAG: hypothetical protein RMK90_14880 [Acetobacteraceae bacterium]|nr:hypothetical protein [Acetobacteraceae bacterium]
MKVVLHIGSEKTGTTSIQHWAAANRAALAARGILYPAAPGEADHGRIEPNHVALALAVAERARRPDLLGMLGLRDADALARFLARLPERLAAEIAASGCATLLLSNEHLSSRVKTAEETAALRRLLEQATAGREVSWQVVLYHRRQDEMIQSFHAMRVLHGHAEPFRLAARAEDPRLDPRRLLDCYAAAFGEAAITVRPFDRRRMPGGDAVADLAALLGLDAAAPGFAPPPRANVSPGPAALELLRLLNPHVPPTVDGRANPARRPLLAAIRALPPEPRSLLAPRAELDRFLARYDAVNAESARRWCGRPDGVLFDPPEPEEASLPVAGPLSAERAVALLAPLLLRALDPKARPAGGER